MFPVLHLSCSTTQYLSYSLRNICTVLPHNTCPILLHNTCPVLQYNTCPVLLHNICSILLQNILPWYNCAGWLGIKHWVTYFHTIFTAFSHTVFNLLFPRVTVHQCNTDICETDVIVANWCDCCSSQQVELFMTVAGGVRLACQLDMQSAGVLLLQSFF